MWIELHRSDELGPKLPISKKLEHFMTQNNDHYAVEVSQGTTFSTSEKPYKTSLLHLGLSHTGSEISRFSNFRYRHFLDSCV